MAIPKGTTVKQKVFVIQGQVVQTRFNEDKGELEYLVNYTDVNGEPAQRWFGADEVEAV